MLKTVIILVLEICVGALVLGPCEKCGEIVDRVFGFVPSAIQGMEPIVSRNQEICNVVRTDTGTNIQRSPNVESSVAVGDERVSFSASTTAITNIRVECKIIQLEEFISRTKRQLPNILPNDSIQGQNGNRTIIAELLNRNLSLITTWEFNNKQYNVTEVHIPATNVNMIQLFLKGDESFTRLGKILTESGFVKVALGNVICKVIKTILNNVTHDPANAEYITTLT